jgi:ribosomal-protein-serine acetyltransferase
VETPHGAEEGHESILLQICHSVPMSRRDGMPVRLELDDFSLRRWNVRDARAMHDAVLHNLDHLRPWMPWVADEPLSPGQRRALLRRWRRHWKSRRDFHFGMFLADGVAGSCGLHNRLGPRSLEIGYWVHVDHVGHGWATRAAAGLTTIGLRMPSIEWIEIHHDEANAASRRIPEKLGYRLVARQHDKVQAPAETGVSWIWRMDREAWRDPFGWRIR